MASDTNWFDGDGVSMHSASALPKIRFLNTAWRN